MKEPGDGANRPGHGPTVWGSNVNEPIPERWLPVVGYEGLYEVSDRGRVRSLDRVVPSRGGWRTHRGKILSAPRNGKYVKYHLHVKGDPGRTFRAHVLVLSAFVGPPDSGHLGRHLDDDPENNALSNLSWGTQGDNMNDAVRNGKHSEAAQTHCRRGHLLAPPNLRVRSLPRRICVSCDRARSHCRVHPELDIDVAADQYYAALIHT
jgi:hypothetical protein